MSSQSFYREDGIRSLSAWTCQAGHGLAVCPCRNVASRTHPRHGLMQADVPPRLPMTIKIAIFAASKRVFFVLKKRMRLQGWKLAIVQNQTLWGQKEAIKNQKQMLKIKNSNSSVCGNFLNQYELSTITFHRRAKIQQVTSYITNFCKFAGWAAKIQITMSRELFAIILLIGVLMFVGLVIMLGIYSRRQLKKVNELKMPPNIEQIRRKSRLFALLVVIISLIFAFFIFGK